MKAISTLVPHAHWLLRAVLASVFVFHGALKLANLQAFSSMLSLSVTTTALVGLAEFVGGILIVAGGVGASKAFDLSTRVGAAFQVPVMLGAIYLVHWGRWNFVPTESAPMGGMQFQVALLLVSLYFVLVGNASIAASGSRPALPDTRGRS